LGRSCFDELHLIWNGIGKAILNSTLAENNQPTIGGNTVYVGGPGKRGWAGLWSLGLGIGLIINWAKFDLFLFLCFQIDDF
jgi:hypothetical protein